MKIAVFSDVHGNNEVFGKALELMKNYGVEEYYFCGDVCGYYYHHNEIIDLFRGMDNLKCVLGNHDKIFLDILDGKIDKLNYRNTYGSAIDKFLSNISKENLSYMRSQKTQLHHTIDNLRIGMFHGNPWDNLNGYCYPDDDVSQFNVLGYDYIFLGHTHYRMYKKAGNTNIVNPGSLGQPRDGEPPSFAVIDTLQETVEFVSVAYEVESLINEVSQNIGEPKYLIEVLKRWSING